MARVRSRAVGPIRSNSYLLFDPEAGEGVIIDAGDEAHAILGMLSPGIRVRYIVATHGHFDHVSAIDEVREALGARFYIHEAEKEILELTPQLSLRWVGVSYQAPEPDGFLHDGDIIDVGGMRVRVIHTPGHSPGSICLYVDDVLFSGDTLFAGSVGRTDAPGGSMEILAASIRERLYVLDDDVTVYPGHGPPTTIGVEKRTNPFVKA